MSNTINTNTNAIPIQIREVPKDSEIYKMADLKLKGPEYAKKKELPSFDVELSKEGREKSERSVGPFKKAGVTSAREAWEDNAAELKRSSVFNSDGSYNLEELMRLDEPDTYAKWREASKKAWALFPSDNATEEEIAAFRSAWREEGLVWNDWFERRCMSTGRFRAPRTGRGAALDSLEAKYSTEGHNTSFNYYTPGKQDGRNSSLWRFCSKFNVLLSSEMYKSLDRFGNINTSFKDKSAVSALLERIDKAVKEMKNVEKQYEGTLYGLQFGVELREDGRVTYHARYAGCGNEEGIMADSADELLEMLMRK